jgi:hypothetical protein
MTNAARFAVVTVLLAGCSSGPTGASEVDAGSKGTVFGSALVGLFPVDQYATVSGQFYDGPTAPPDRPLEVRMQQAGCQLFTEVACNPSCGAGTYCSNSKACVANPNPIGVGTVHVEGLSGMSLVIEPVPPKNNYTGPTLQPYPPCAEGASITLKSDRFTVGIKCIRALVLTSPVPIPVAKGQPMHVAWTPPGQPGISRVQLELEISHHGGYKGQVNCDVADTGSFDIPAALITALVDLGVAGYPSVKVNRLSSSSPPSEPGATLSMASLLEVAVDVAGFISCGGPTSPPCPSGMTCDSALMLCKR